MSYKKKLLLYFSFLLIFQCKKPVKPNKIKYKQDILLMQKTNDSNFFKIPNHEIAIKKRIIDSFFNNTYKTIPLNGSVLIAQNGKIIYEKYNGIANFKTNSPIKSYTPLHIASVSKVITASIILKMIDCNKIKLNQKVNTILLEFPYPEITIKTLLNHRSGLQNYAYFTTPDSIWDKSKTLKNKDILNILATHKLALNFKPDTKFTYCNTNYAILALIIEKVLKIPYKEAVQKIVFDPLEMNNSYVFDYKEDKNYATPSYKKNKQLVPFDFLDAIYGDKNIYATPRDLLKFDRARTSTNFLKPELLKQVYTAYSNEYKGEKNYGLGIRILEFKTGQKLFFHNGWWHGNTASYISMKNEGVTIISLSNKLTVNTYAVRKLTALFGDYPFDLENEQE